MGWVGSRVTQKNNTMRIICYLAVITPMQIQPLENYSWTANFCAKHNTNEFARRNFLFRLFIDGFADWRLYGIGAAARIVTVLTSRK